MCWCVCKAGCETAARRSSWPMLLFPCLFIVILSRNQASNNNSPGRLKDMPPQPPSLVPWPTTRKHPFTLCNVNENKSPVKLARFTQTTLCDARAFSALENYSSVILIPPAWNKTRSAQLKLTSKIVKKTTKISLIDNKIKKVPGNHLLCIFTLAAWMCWHNKTSRHGYMADKVVVDNVSTMLSADDLQLK